MKHLSEAQLNDLADGLADSAAHAHLAACRACREEFDQVRHIVAALQSLPQAVAPARDLLAGINQRIDTQPVAIERAQPARLQGTARTLWSARWLLAAAAVLLIVATAVLTRALSDRSGSPAQMARSGSGSVLVSQQTQAVTRSYESAIVELEELLTAQRSKLAPATVQLLEENLRVIDRAIQESRAALEGDPNSELINEWLRSAYERKLDLLRRAATFAAT